jgi:hypothetical protein
MHRIAGMSYVRLFALSTSLAVFAAACGGSKPATDPSAESGAVDNHGTSSSSESTATNGSGTDPQKGDGAGSADAPGSGNSNSDATQ